MAELATVARPYAEALFESLGDTAQDAQVWLDQLAGIVADPDLQQLADNPRVLPAQLLDVLMGALGKDLPERGRNFLRTVVEAKRLRAVPEMVRQFRALVSQGSGVTDAVVYTPFEISEAALQALGQGLQKRFGRALNLSQQLDPSLIGGIRVVAGDEVLDLSVRARLQEMKTVLTAH